MGSSYSFDGDRLAPYVCEDIAELWNKYKPAKWRTWQHSKSNSKSKSAYRLTVILRENRKWLDCGRSSDIDDLYDQFKTYLLMALAYIEREGVDKVNAQLGTQYEITIGFWGFCRDLQNIHHLAHLGMGNEPDQALTADADRRREKAQILKDFHDEVKGFIKKAAYVSGSAPDSNKRLEQALELARQALMRAEEDLEWSEG